MAYESRRFNAAFTKSSIILILSQINLNPHTDSYHFKICSNIQ